MVDFDAHIKRGHPGKSTQHAAERVFHSDMVLFAVIFGLIVFFAIIEVRKFTCYITASWLICAYNRVLLQLGSFLDTTSIITTRLLLSETGRAS